MKQTARNIIFRLNSMKKTEASLALSWVAAMVLGYFIAKVNLTVGSAFLILAMIAALLGAVNEAMMFKMRHKLKNLSKDSQVFALWVRNY